MSTSIVNDNILKIVVFNAHIPTGTSLSYDKGAVGNKDSQRKTQLSAYRTCSNILNVH